MNKNKRGISLIVLIITIIVIIILAAAVILTMSNNNPIENANEARFKEDIRTMQDELSMYISKKYSDDPTEFDPKSLDLEGDTMAEELPSTETYKTKVKVEDGKLIWIEKPESEQDEEYIIEKGWYDEFTGNIVASQTPDTPVIQGTKDPEGDLVGKVSKVTEDGVPIPIGFTYVQGSKDTGVVIKDENNNEFVWVVANAQSYAKDATFPKSSASNPDYYNVENFGDDTLPSGISSESSDVEKYGGFYISRYEAGIPQGDTSASDKTGVPLSQQRKIVWTNISYSNAKASAESMISNNYVQTGLITETAWDTTCHFIKDTTELTDSVAYGNYKDSTFLISLGDLKRND